jgi:hypothetical protein
MLMYVATVRTAIAVTFVLALGLAGHTSSAAQALGFFDELAGKTCIGSVRFETGKFAGLNIPIKVRLFRQSDGSPWAKFWFLARAPVNLAVFLTEEGLTFRGLYGTQYSLSGAGPNHLTGQAHPPDEGPIDLHCQ